MKNENFSIGQKKLIENKFYLDVFAVNGLANPCPKNDYFNNKSHHLKILSYKIFNSNSGYGILVCKKEKK